MSKLKIVFTDYYYPNNNTELAILAELGDDIEVVDCTKKVSGGVKAEDELLAYVKDADAIIVQFAQISARVIEQLDRCKVIARYAIGVDNIDIPAATKKKIYVANVPDYCIDEVADTAMGHILNGVRKMSCARDLLLKNEFAMSAIRPVKRIEDCALGLLGFGNIARNLAKKGAHFFNEILAFDPYFSDQESYPSIKFVSKEELLNAADVISIHVPLNDSTRGMLGKTEFGMMKDGVVVVNTARGGIFDERALQASLDSGKVSFCGLDVLSTEDFASSPLLRNPKVMLTPHISWYSEGAMDELQEKTARNIVSMFTNGCPVYAVNDVGD
ncbi:MAG: C-terminal binding protein [Chloroflexota bacterium]|nr:C-terminal binding protein [Chloroflexota bacterium]